MGLFPVRGVAGVKPFVKRQKTDAEAICEAASRPTMGFVAVETREQQAQGMFVPHARFVPHA